MSADIITNLCSSKKIERDAGLAELQRILPRADKDTKTNLQDSIVRILNDSRVQRESQLGCLLASKLFIQVADVDCEKDTGFAGQILCIAQRTLCDDVDGRIILACGEALGALCSKIGVEAYLEGQERLLQIIEEGLDQISKPPETGRVPATCRRRSSAEGNVTCGVLESRVRALQAIIEGCAGKFAPYITDDFLAVLTKALREHKNRGVREAAFYLAATTAQASVDLDNPEGQDGGGIFHISETVLQHLASGLEDDWSPIRLAASVATRKYLLALPNDKYRKMYYSTLLPRMCLNRYYSAEGVRIYSQETWRQLAGCAGRELVQQFIQDVINFYIGSAQSTNYAVREAACACIAELANKLQAAAVRPYVPQLLKTLKTCFSDDSWPVRDAACLACGSFILHFPTESRDMLPELYPLFFRNLEDAIPSVRAGAASALGTVVRSQGDAALSQLLERISNGLMGLSKQPTDAPDTSFSRRGVSYTITPRLGRAGSTDHKFHRVPQPWELADGCVVLMAELCTLPLAVPHLPPVLPLLADACNRKHYVAHLTFLETVCKHLPTIARAIGKKQFKVHLESFLGPVFYSLESESALTSSAASQCLNQLSSYLGPNILRSRVQVSCPHHLRHLDANLFIAPF